MINLEIILLLLCIHLKIFLFSWIPSLRKVCRKNLIMRHSHIIFLNAWLMLIKPFSNSASFIRRKFITPENNRRKSETNRQMRKSKIFFLHSWSTFLFSSFSYPETVCSTQIPILFNLFFVLREIRTWLQARKPTQRKTIVCVSSWIREHFSWCFPVVWSINFKAKANLWNIISCCYDDVD